MGCAIGEQPTAGRCPRCGMDLVQVRNGRLAHRDHQPKHGGVFFMAPDGRHHLEGTLPNAREFRLYLYDEFTEPSREPLTGEVTLRDGSAVKLEAEPGGRFFRAAIPDGRLPVQLTAHLRFSGAQQIDVFDFDLPATTGE
jgi:hypothetical protein